MIGEFISCEIHQEKMKKNLKVGEGESALGRGNGFCDLFLLSSVFCVRMCREAYRISLGRLIGQACA